MFGVAGFLVLAITVGAYAYTSSTNYRLVPTQKRQLFVTAYSILSLAAIVWLGTFFAADRAVPQLVFMTEIMLVAATVSILGVVLGDIAKPLVLATVAFTGSALLTLRAFSFPSEAYIANGLLYFNLSQTEALIIGLIFLAIWLPATVQVVNMAFSTRRFLPLRSYVTYVFIATVLMTSFFLSARRSIVIIISFISILFFFTILTGINIVLGRTIQAHKKQKAAHNE